DLAPTLDEPFMRKSRLRSCSLFQPQFTRRETIAALAASAALPLLSRGTPAFAQGDREAQAKVLLDSIAEDLLRHNPEQATSLGIDIGARAAMRSQLGDRSAAGQASLAATLRTDLARAEAFDTAGLSFPTRTTVEVVRSAYK